MEEIVGEALGGKKGDDHTCSVSVNINHHIHIKKFNQGYSDIFAMPMMGSSAVIMLADRSLRSGSIL